MSTKGVTNQKQWVAHDESIDKTMGLIKKVNLYVVVVPIVLAILVGVLIGQFIVLPIVGVLVGIGLQRAIVSSSRSAFAEVASSPTASESDHARMYNVVDGLCVVSGDPRPRLVVVDSVYPVAVAALDGNNDPVIGISPQFVNIMTRVEVEAVAAHLLWRLRVGHAHLIAFYVGLGRILSFVGLGALVQRMASRTLPAEIVTVADIAACQATRFPPAAVSALEKCDASQGAVSLGAGDFLCFALPSDHEGDADSGHKVSNLVLSRPRLSERAAILKEM